STVQADFNLPERFDMTYVDKDGSFVRPVMVHRALLGSMERFFGVLIEHYGGAFPCWLAPVQVAVLAVGERHAARAEELAQAMRAQGVRAQADVGPEKIGNKIRHHLYEEKVPYIGVVGDKEVESGGISLRHRQDGDLGALSLEQAVEAIAAKTAARR